MLFLPKIIRIPTSGRQSANSAEYIITYQDCRINLQPTSLCNVMSGNGWQHYFKALPKIKHKHASTVNDTANVEVLLHIRTRSYRNNFRIQFVDKKLAYTCTYRVFINIRPLSKCLYVYATFVYSDLEFG